MVRVFYTQRQQGGRVQNDHASVVSMDSSITTVITEDAPAPLMATMIMASTDDESYDTPEMANISPVMSFSEEDVGYQEDEPGRIRPRSSRGAFRKDRHRSTGNKIASNFSHDKGKLAGDEAGVFRNNAPNGALDYVLRPCPNSPKQLEVSLDGSLQTVDRVLRASSSWIDCTRRNGVDDNTLDLEAPDDEIMLYTEQQKQKQREQKNVILKAIDDPWLDNIPCSPNGSSHCPPSLPFGKNNNMDGAHYGDDVEEGSDDDFGIQPTNSWLEYMGITARQPSQDYSKEDDGIDTLLKPSFSWIRTRADDCGASPSRRAPSPRRLLPEEEENRAIGQEIYQIMRSVRLPAPSLLPHGSTTSPNAKVSPSIDKDSGDIGDSNDDESTLGTGPFEVEDMAIYAALEQKAIKVGSADSDTKVNVISKDEQCEIGKSGEDEDSKASGNGTYKDEQFELKLVPDGNLEHKTNGFSGSTKLESNLEQTASNDDVSTKLDNDKKSQLAGCNGNGEAMDNGPVLVHIEKQAKEQCKKAQSEEQIGEKIGTKKQELIKEAELMFQEAGRVAEEQQMKEIVEQLNEDDEEQQQQRQMQQQPRLIQNESDPQPVILPRRAIPVDPPSSAEFEAKNNTNGCFVNCDVLGSIFSSMIPARETCLSKHSVQAVENLDLEEGISSKVSSIIDDDTDAHSTLQPQTNCLPLSPFPISRRTVPKKHVRFQVFPLESASESLYTDEELSADVESSTYLSSVNSTAEKNEHLQAHKVSVREDEHPGLLSRMYEAIETSEERHLQQLNEVLPSTSSGSTESSSTNDPAIDSKSKKTSVGSKKIGTKVLAKKNAPEQSRQRNKNMGFSRHRCITCIILLALAGMVVVLIVSALAVKSHRDKVKASSQASPALSGN